VAGVQDRELIDVLNHDEPSHARHEVERYGHDFLGSAALSHKRGQRFIVVGQQRLSRH